MALIDPVAGLCQQLLAKQPAPFSDGSDISSALLAWNSTDPLPRAGPLRREKVNQVPNRRARWMRFSRRSAALKIVNKRDATV